MEKWTKVCGIGPTWFRGTKNKSPLEVFWEKALKAMKHPPKKKLDVSHVAIPVKVYEKLEKAQVAWYTKYEGISVFQAQKIVEWDLLGWGPTATGSKTGLWRRS